jgi:hypothetical protein
LGQGCRFGGVEDENEDHHVTGAKQRVGVREKYSACRGRGRTKHRGGSYKVGGGAVSGTSSGTSSGAFSASLLEGGPFPGPGRGELSEGCETWRNDEGRLKEQRTQGSFILEVGRDCAQKRNLETQTSERCSRCGYAGRVAGYKVNGWIRFL